MKSLKSLTYKIWTHDQLRFLIVGGVNTLFGLFIFPFLYLTLSQYRVHYQIILVLSWIIATTFSFSTNRMLVFRGRGRIFHEYIKFISFHFFSLILNIMIFAIFVDYLALDPVVVQIIFVLVMAFGSYFWYKIIAFPQKHTS